MLKKYDCSAAKVENKQAMNMNLITLLYLGGTVCFIQALLKGLPLTTT